MPASMPEATDNRVRAAGADRRRGVIPCPVGALPSQTTAKLPLGADGSRRWPLLAQALGAEVWVKHENHNPTGAFKVRGGLTFMDHLRQAGNTLGVISASRGNHCQSLAFAGRVYGIPVTIVVPEGNSPDKNAAARAFGAELIEHGDDFQTALEHSQELAQERGLTAVPPFHPWLIEGVATYGAELQEDAPGLDAIYVPIGMGSGICGNIIARDLAGSDTEIVGVVAEQAPAYALSLDAGHLVSTEAANTLIDGIACRVPDPVALATIRQGVSRVVQVSDRLAQEAMVMMFRATHNLAEPAGAAALAGALADRERNAGRRIAVVNSGGNADFDVLRDAFEAVGHASLRG